MSGARRYVTSACAICHRDFKHRFDYDTQTCSHACTSEAKRLCLLEERRGVEVAQAVICPLASGRWIAVSHGDGYEFAIVDDDMFERVSEICWTWHNGYASIHHKGRRHLFLHHLVIGSPPNSLQVDHINRNRLDDRRENLRFVTREGNMRNRGALKNNKSSYKGVWLEDKWRACIRIDGHTKHLGSFETAEEAASAYDKAACEAWGEHAALNFPVVIGSTRGA